MYRLRLTLLNEEVIRALIHMAGDNLSCIVAVPGLLLYAAAGLGIEWLALALLRREQWVRFGGGVGWGVVWCGGWVGCWLGLQLQMHLIHHLDIAT